MNSKIYQKIQLLENKPVIFPETSHFAEGFCEYFWIRNLGVFTDFRNFKSQNLKITKIVIFIILEIQKKNLKPSKTQIFQKPLKIKFLKSNSKLNLLDL